jgi:hypothetical protein
MVVCLSGVFWTSHCLLGCVNEGSARFGRKFAVGPLLGEGPERRVDIDKALQQPTHDQGPDMAMPRFDGKGLHQLVNTHKESISKIRIVKLGSVHHREPREAYRKG